MQKKVLCSKVALINNHLYSGVIRKKIGPPADAIVYPFFFNYKTSYPNITPLRKKASQILAVLIYGQNG